MNYLKRILCFLLALTSIIPLLAGCSSKKTDDEIYLTKGEFLSYFVYENNMTSNVFTTDDIINSKDGSVEAKIVAEWGYIDIDSALDKLTKPVDRETVVTVCANATGHLKTGNTSSIKDADMLKNPQLIANAYASGLIELENGYFAGASKMSFTDCEEILDKCRDYIANFHFEANTEKYEIADDAITFDPEDYHDGDIVIEFGDDITDNSVSGMSFNQNGNDTPAFTFLNATYQNAEPTISFLGRTSLTSGTEARIVNTSAPLYTLPTKNSFQAHFSKAIFEGTLKNPKIGDTVYIPCYNVWASPGVIGQRNNNEIVGILKNAQLIGSEYWCDFEVPTFEGAVEKKNVTEANKSGIQNFKIEEKEYMGWKLDFDVSNGGVKISAKKDFTVHETGRKQDWQNSKKTITAEAKFSIGDFNVDVENLRSFANKKGTGSVKITCDSSFDLTLSTSLRYTPDSNRNGKFPSNWNNSRWTDSDSKGAKEIKIAKFTPSFYGIVGGEIYIYLRISLDGKISFGTSIDDGGVEITTNNGNIKCLSLGTKKDKLEASANLVTKLGVRVSLTIFSFIKVISYDIGLQLDLNLVANLYYEKELSAKSVFADEEGLAEYAADDGKFNYCLGITYSLDVIGTLEESGVKLIMDWVGKGDALNFKYHICSGGLHFEDGHFVDACTRGDDPTDGIVVSDDGEIVLSTYKVTISQYTCSYVDVKKLPTETIDLYKSKNSVTVSSRDEDIVKAYYDKGSCTINLEAVGEGSTELVITAKKKTGFWWWQKETVVQYVSVTVTGYYDSATSAA